MKILFKTILKIQDKIVSCIFKIRYYLEDTILPNTGSAADIFGPGVHDFILQQDGAPCHTAKI